MEGLWIAGEERAKKAVLKGWEVGKKVEIKQQCQIFTSVT